MEQVSVRYIVADVDAAIPFYTEMLGFHLDMHPAPGFAMPQLSVPSSVTSRDGACNYHAPCAAL